MQNVSYQVTIGGESLASGPSSTLLALEVRAGLRVPVNACRLVLHGRSELSAAAGDPVTVALGYDGSDETVFTGVVSSVAHAFQQVEVEALGAFTALTAARLNLLYEQETAGGMVSDVLGKLTLAEGTVEAGLKVAAYAMNDGRSAWAHLDSLARRCGFLFYADEEDQAHFKAYDPAATHALAYGSDILAYQHDARPADVVGVEIHGDSPAGQGQGDDASSWFTKKEVKGTAGESTGRVLRLFDPAARNTNVAGDIAAGVLAGYQRSAGGRLRVLGAPRVRLGDAVELSKLPASAHNGEARVAGVLHRVGPRVGFVTDIAWEKS
jgi:hypothetical protein